MSESTPSAQLRELITLTHVEPPDPARALGIDLDTFATWDRRRTPLEPVLASRLTKLLAFARLGRTYLNGDQFGCWLTVSNPDLKGAKPLDRLLIGEEAVTAAFLSEVLPAYERSKPAVA